MGTSSRFTNNNKAVVLLYPVVPNPNTSFSEISEWTKYFSVTDLKDTF